MPVRLMRNLQARTRLPPKKPRTSRIGDFVQRHAVLGTPKKVVFDMVYRKYLARKGFDKRKARFMAEFYIKQYYDPWARK